MLVTIALATLLVAPAPSFPPGSAATVNVIEWDANELPKVFQRSEQLPLSEEDLSRLSKAGFEPRQLVKMLEERRCACDASADGLLRLKSAGVHREVLEAVSTHALAPNRAVELELTLDFTGEGDLARESFLYLFVEDGPLTRVFSANLGELLARRNAHEELVDRSDLLRAKRARRVQLAGRIPLKTYGARKVMVAASASPSVTHPSQLSDAERQRAQLHTIDYPRASLASACRLTAGYRRDPVLAHKWRLAGSRFECEWN